MDIDELAIQLFAEGVDLEQEDDATGFLGLHIKPDPETGSLKKMTQKVLIKQVLDTLWEVHRGQRKVSCQSCTRRDCHW